MTGARMDRPHREAGIAMRPSRFLMAAMAVFVGIVGAAVFHCVLAYGGKFDAIIVTLACVAALGLTARLWMRRQPVAIEAHADSLVTWDRRGEARDWRIVGCAQLGGRLLALTVSSGKTSGKPRSRTLLVAADSIDADTFRQLAVSARRAARAYL